MTNPKFNHPMAESVETTDLLQSPSLAGVLITFLVAWTKYLGPTMERRGGLFWLEFLVQVGWLQGRKAWWKLWQRKGLSSCGPEAEGKSRRQQGGR